LLIAAAAAHCRCAEAAAALADSLLYQSSTPLQRLTRVRTGLDQLRSETTRFRHLSTMFAAGLRGRSADVPIDTLDFCDRSEVALRTLVRLYLKEARVRLAPAVVHGEDFIGFEPAQLVALADVAQLDALASDLALASVANAAKLARAMPRRLRQERSTDFAVAESAAESFRAAVKGFAATLQPADPESVEYRSRPGERGTRTLDGMIARFDRGGILAVAD
jgi:hypothetical protein